MWEILQYHNGFDMFSVHVIFEAVKIVVVVFFLADIILIGEPCKTSVYLLCLWLFSLWLSTSLHLNKLVSEIWFKSYICFPLRMLWVSIFYYGCKVFECKAWWDKFVGKKAISEWLAKVCDKTLLFGEEDELVYRFIWLRNYWNGMEWNYPMWWETGNFLWNPFLEYHIVI